MGESIPRHGRTLRSRQRLGKYRIERRLESGGFANVYAAYDTVEGIRVALKIPHPHLVGKETIEMFKKEARLVARLEHPNILGLKTADDIDGQFVIVSLLGKASLEDRLQRRISVATALDLGQQMLAGLAHAHSQNIIHCDVKPDNLLLFAQPSESGLRLRLTDFGIAKVAQNTLRAHGTGTFGYVAPEQAMGRPSFRSDVFAAGLVLYRMLTGSLPEWPFTWPFAGYERLRGRVHADLIAVLRRSLALDPRGRFADAQALLGAFRPASTKTLAALRRKAGARASRNGRASKRKGRDRDWKTVRLRQFRREYGKQLAARGDCPQCEGPISESMAFCPWCRRRIRRWPTEGTRSSKLRNAPRCPRCRRQVRGDWRFCPWCWGGRIGPVSERESRDSHYLRACRASRCSRRLLLPFMRYCPWCHARVQRRWPIVGSRGRCRSCGWGVLSEYWANCPWCSTTIRAEGG